MGAKRKAKQPRKVTQNSDSKRPVNPKSLANLQPFKSREELAGQLDPRINVGGRPKRLGEAYNKVLESTFPRGLISAIAPAMGAPSMRDIVDSYAGKDADITYADKIALTQTLNAASGDTAAARELRQATEGDRLTLLATWQSELVDALKAGKLTALQVMDELGADEAKTILLAAGIVNFDRTSTEPAGAIVPEGASASSTASTGTALPVPGQ